MLKELTNNKYIRLIIVLLLIPILFVGFKLGLANIVVVYVLYKHGFKEALLISILRVLLVSMLRTGLFSITFYFSITGAILSIIMMSLFKLTKLSVIGVSVIGSISHIIGQIFIAFLILNTSSLFTLLPFLMIFSCITGVIIGIISMEIINKV